MKWFLFCALMFILSSCGVKGDPMPPIDKSYKADAGGKDNNNREKKSNKDVDKSKELKDLSE
jgi:predicted small lipoprotein YifL